VLLFAIKAGKLGVPMPKSTKIVTEAPVPKEPGDAFTVEVGRVMAQVRAALGDMFSAFPNGIRKSRDAQKFLGVDSNLSWQLLKVLATPDPIGASRYVPPPVSMRRVFDAALEKGIHADQVKAAESAVEEFEELIRNYAGDRASFESMVAGRVDGDYDESIRQADLQNRKGIFKGHMYYWGMEVETRVVSMMVGPNKEHPELYDYAFLRSFNGLRRLRAEVNMVVDRFNIRMLDKDVVETVREPLDPASMQRYGAPLVEKFCSRPVPEFQTIVNEFRESRTELISPEIGQRSRVDLTFANIMRSVPVSLAFDGAGRMVGSQTRVWVPTKLLMMHLLVHRDHFPRQRLHSLLKVQGHALQTVPGELRDPHGILPFPEQLTYIGRGAVGTHTLDVQRHVEMASYMAQVGGWDLEDFDVYRARIEYPLLDTTVGVYLTWKSEDSQ
jgi:hypothetical protein